MNWKQTSVDSTIDLWKRKVSFSKIKLFKLWIYRTNRKSENSSWRKINDFDENHFFVNRGQIFIWFRNKTKTKTNDIHQSEKNILNDHNKLKMLTLCFFLKEWYVISLNLNLSLIGTSFDNQINRNEIVPDNTNSGKYLR